METTCHPESVVQPVTEAKQKQWIVTSIDVDQFDLKDRLNQLHQYLGLTRQRIVDEIFDHYHKSLPSMDYCSVATRQHTLTHILYYGSHPTLKSRQKATQAEWMAEIQDVVVMIENQIAWLLNKRRITEFWGANLETNNDLWIDRAACHGL